MGRAITFTIPIYFNVSKKKQVMVGLNWFRNAHFMVTNNCKRYYSKLINEQHVALDKIKGKVHVHYNIYLKRKGSDGGNVRSVIEKFVLDGIVKAGIITDDNANVVVSDSANYYFDKNNPRAEITLTSVGK
jgi:hypothetical protein